MPLDVMTVSETSSGTKVSSSPSPTAVQAATVDERTYLTRLMLSEFRSYELAEVRCDGRSVVLFGPNGAGKTNLLEALSLLAPGRGLRQVKLSDVIRQTKPEAAAPPRPWAVAADVMTPLGLRRLGTGIDPSRTGNRERRSVRIDDGPARGQQVLSEVLPLVWLTPQMDALFREAASGRRRFLDRLVYGIDPSHASRVNSYEHSLRERSRLLRQGLGDDKWLASLEDSMARHGVAITVARHDLISRLAAIAAKEMGPFPGAQMSLDCEIGQWLAEMPALAAEDRLKEALATTREGDGQAGGAAHGPHRGDLRVFHVAKAMPAHKCSTGEQKALLIAIVMAFARLLGLSRGTAPVLLLDEVAAHLDVERRHALFSEIGALGMQSWMTGTDQAVFADLGSQAQFFQIGEGTVVPARAPLVQ